MRKCDDIKESPWGIMGPCWNLGALENCQGNPEPESHLWLIFINKNIYIYIYTHIYLVIIWFISIYIYIFFDHIIYLCMYRLLVSFKCLYICISFINYKFIYIYIYDMIWYDIISYITHDLSLYIYTYMSTINTYMNFSMKSAPQMCKLVENWTQDKNLKKSPPK